MSDADPAGAAGGGRTGASSPRRWTLVVAVLLVGCGAAVLVAAASTGPSENATDRYIASHHDGMSAGAEALIREARQSHPPASQERGAVALAATQIGGLDGVIRYTPNDQEIELTDPTGPNAPGEYDHVYRYAAGGQLDIPHPGEGPENPWCGQDSQGIEAHLVAPGWVKVSNIDCDATSFAGLGHAALSALGVVLLLAGAEIVVVNTWRRHRRSRTTRGWDESVVPSESP